MHTLDTLTDFLAVHNIAYTHHTHFPVFTVEESEKITDHLPGMHIKNLFLYDKKKTGLWLVTVQAQKRVDLKSLKDLLGARGNLSFCKPEVLMEHLGVTPGSVTPLAPINDTEGKVQVYLDEDMMTASLINAHPLRNDMTTALSPTDLVKFLELTGHTPQMIKIPEIETSLAA